MRPSAPTTSSRGRRTSRWRSHPSAESAGPAAAAAHSGGRGEAWGGWKREWPRHPYSKVPNESRNGKRGRLGLAAMNPIVHAELSWLAAQGLRERRDRILVVCAGLAPDLDGLTLLAGEEWYGRYHHVLFHGYVGALITTAVCAALARQRAWVAGLSLAAFHLHLLCDLAGSGPGWPIH